MGGLISAVGNLFGGAPNNSSFQAQGTNLVQPTTADQTGTAYNQAQSGLGQQQSLINALNAQNGIGNQSAVFGQLQNVANGTGPNPAQAMLNQATGQNVANQAALMAGQRGAASNAGLMARQAAQQGAATQQNAIGQGATLQANQSLGALGQMGGLANTQAGQQIGAVGNYNQAAQNEQGQLLGALGQQNAQNVAMQSNMNSTNEAMASGNAANTANALGGLFGGIGASGAMGSGIQNYAMAGVGGAKGGEVEKDKIVPPKGENPKIAQVPVKNRFPGAEAHNMHYPAHLQQVAHFYHGGMDFRSGGAIPGDPKVMKDSPKNDVVDAKLSPKEIVLPISVTQSENPPEEAAKFVAATLAKSGSKMGHEKEFKEALKKAISGRKGSK
jgi:hypothetical protein